MITPTVLTRDGCDRATAYHQANKIVRAPEGLYVTWLDGAYRCILAHVTPDGELAGTLPMARAFDNHCGGAIVRTPDGLLHFVSGSHHVSFSYRCSATPMRPESWSLPECAGALATYPSLVCDLEGRLHLANRYSTMDKANGHWGVCWTPKLPGRAWRKAAPICRMPAPLYAYPTNALAVGPDGVLHMVVEWYKTWPAERKAGDTAARPGYASDAREAAQRPRSLGVSHFEMHGLGEWRHTDGRAATCPAGMENAPLVIPGGDGNPRPGNIAVLPDGRPVFGTWDQLTGDLRLASRQLDGLWRISELTEQVEAFDPGRHFAGQPQVAVNAAGQVVLVAPRAEQVAWSHPTSQLHVYWIDVDAGKVVRHKPVARADADEPDWLPSIEKPGPGVYPEALFLIYQTGRRGETCVNDARCSVNLACIE